MTCEVEITIAPQTVTVEIADPNKVGVAGATIVSAEINDDSVLDFLMSDGRHILVDNWLTTANAIEQQYTALSSVSSSRVVSYDGTNISYASNDNSASAYTVVGVTRQAGTSVYVVREGELTDLSFSFTPNSPVFLGLNGALTQTAPSSGFVLQVAVALTTTKIQIGVDDPIFI